MRNKVIRELANQAWFRPSIILDVGANIGQSAQEFSTAFPAARIIAFEPIAASYAELCKTVKGLSNVEPIRIALGAERGTLIMTANGLSTANHVVERPRCNTEPVPAYTGDEFCCQRSIDRVDFLKIDTEGHDLRVIEGFVAMLRTSKIELVQVECGFSPENQYHATYEQVNDIFLPLGYRLWGIYGLTRRLGRKLKRGVMYGDAVYIAPEGAM